MEGEKSTESIGGVKQFERTVHHVLAHSYSSYFFLFLFSILLDLIFPIKVFHNSYMVPIGFALLVLASALIIWAQVVSRNLTEGEISKETFCRGPYCYTRKPTHWGLFLLILGFGVVANAFFTIIAAVISFFISKLIFLRKHEVDMVNKYGDSYAEYKKSVKF